MNLRTCVQCSLALAWLLGGCQPSTPSAQPEVLSSFTAAIPTVAAEAGTQALLPQPGQGSMKGFELYSWQEGDEWVFSVLIGTNREKTLAEITAPAARLVGPAELEAMLRTLPAGEVVTWQGVPPQALPPQAITQTVERVCVAQGLQLSLPPGSGN
jgi:hypothetical protein